MEASSKIVSFLFASILSGQSSCALSLDHAVGMHWKCCSRRALVSQLLKPPWLYYRIADEQKLQGPDPRPARSWCGTTRLPGQPHSAPSQPSCPGVCFKKSRTHVFTL